MDMDYSLFQGELSIVLIQENGVSSFVMGYHKYCETWNSIVGHVLKLQMEPGNAVDKHAVSSINE